MHHLGKIGKKSRRNQTSYAKTITNWSSLDTMVRTEKNNERQNATELSHEVEIRTTVIREELSNPTLPIQRNYYE